MGTFSSTIGISGPRVQRSTTFTGTNNGKPLLGGVNTFLDKLSDTKFAYGEQMAPLLGMPRKQKMTFVLLNTSKKPPSIRDLIRDPTTGLVNIVGNVLSGTGAGTAMAKLLGLGGDDASRTRASQFQQVEMYINPANMILNYQKLITPTQTQGGMVYQYWGEKPVEMKFDGVTGMQGMRGINTLYNVWMNQSKQFGRTDGTQDWSPGQIDIHFKGVVYTGHFNTFNVTENADSPGNWKYDMSFTILETSGIRTRF